MIPGDPEDEKLRSVAMMNAASILIARQRAERELIAAKEALEEKTAELAQSAAELREQREWLRVTLSSIGDAVITTDLDAKVTFLNPVAEKMTGWTNDQARGQPAEEVFHIIHESTRQPAENPIRRVLREGTTVALANHTALLSRDGREVAIEDSAAPIRDAAGNVIGAVMVFHDVTERRRTEQQLWESEARLRVSLETAALGTWEFKCPTNTITLDARGQELMGSDHATLSFDDFVDTAHPMERERRRRALREVLAGKRERHEIEFRVGAGENWVRSSAKPVRDSSGTIVGLIGAVLDITDLMKARATNEERRIELEGLIDERTASLQQAIAQMEEFSYSVSHDLRAPLRAIQTYAQTVLEDFGDKVGPQGAEFLQRILNAGGRMDRLTRDVLSYSKIARGNAPLAVISLDRLVAETIESYAPRQREQGLLTVAGPLLPVLGNEPLLVQVISNLLANAIKFVDEGNAVRIHVKTEACGEDVRLWVEDNGIGIRPEHQRRIWGMFERLHPNEKYEGTGIGLAIVRKAVERMGGTVGVESNGSGGCRFWIQLRAA